MLGLSYTSTASTIATDLACAVLPAIILWQTQMKTSKKVSVSIIFSFGSLASVSTMIRAPYIDHYNRPLEDLPYHIANIPLWSNIEIAIGLIAGSLPALRQFFVHHRSAYKSAVDPRAHVPVWTDLVTIGGSGASKNKGNKPSKSSFQLSEVGRSTWTHLDDNGLDQEVTVPIRGIRKHTTFMVEETDCDYERGR